MDSDLCQSLWLYFLECCGSVWRLCHFADAEEYHENSAANSETVNFLQLGSSRTGHTSTPTIENVGLEIQDIWRAPG